MPAERRDAAPSSGPVLLGGHPAAVGLQHLALLSVALVASLGLSFVSSTLATAVLVLGVLLPSVTPALAGLWLPSALGSRSVAFPRLYRAGLFLSLAGLVLVTISGFLGAPTVVPARLLLNTALFAELPNVAVRGMLMGAALLAVAAVFTALTVVVTCHKQRAPGVTWARMPLGAWGAYAHTVATLIAAPVLLGMLFVLAVDHVLGVGLVDVSIGGDPAMLLHPYWMGMHPLLMGALLPVVGLALELLSARAPVRGAGGRGQHYALVLFALLGVFAYPQHAPAGAMSEAVSVLGSFFGMLSLAPLLYLVLSGLRIVSWWPRDRRVVLGALGLLTVTAFAMMALAAASLPLHVGRDLVLFAGSGRIVLAAAVAVGLATVWSQRVLAPTR